MIWSENDFEFNKIFILFGNKMAWATEIDAHYRSFNTGHMTVIPWIHTRFLWNCIVCRCMQLASFASKWGVQWLCPINWQNLLRYHSESMQINLQSTKLPNANQDKVNWNSVALYELHMSMCTIKTWWVLCNLLQTHRCHRPTK